MKKECEIVEDLLFGYSDDTLNAESKKLVEEHLKGCDECKKKLETIKKENDFKNDEVKALKYFKKFRRKNMIKIIWAVIGVLVLIVLGIYLRKFFIISKIQSKVAELYSKDNIYTEEVTVTGDGMTSILRKYYKDRKFKEVTTFCNDSGENIFMTNYIDLDKKTLIKVNNYSDTYEVYGNKKFNDMTEKTIYLDIYDAFLTNKFETIFLFNVDTIENAWGKYYVFTYADDKTKESEFWVDAETLLPAKYIQKEARITCYNGTNIVKQISDEIRLYNYSFDTVTDEDLRIDLMNMKQVEAK